MYLNEQPIDNYVILANYTDKYTLTVEISGTSYGSTNPTAGMYSYDPGSTATVTAASKTGGQFDGWTGDGTGSGATRTITMNGNKSVKAWFSEKQAPTTYSVTGTASPSSYGTVTGSASGLSDGAAWKLTASANSGYVFVNWDGDTSLTNTTISGNINKADVKRVAYFKEAGPFTVKYFQHRAATTASDTQTIEKGQYSTAPTLTLSGWNFSHWTDGVGGSVFDPSTTPINKDLNLYAVWTMSVERTMTIAKDKGSDTTLIISSKTMPNGTVVSIGGSYDYKHDANVEDHWVNIDAWVRSAGYSGQGRTTLTTIKTDKSNDWHYSLSMSTQSITVPSDGHSYSAIDINAGKNTSAAHSCEVVWNIKVYISATLS